MKFFIYIYILIITLLLSACSSKQEQINDIKSKEENINTSSFGVAFSSKQEMIDKMDSNKKIMSRLSLGDVYYQSLDYEKALIAYKEEAKKNNLKAIHKIGMIYEKKSMVNNAFLWYEKANKLEFTTSIVRIGMLYSKLKNYKKAIYFYKRAANLKDPDGYFQLGLLYGTNKEIQDVVLAREYLDKILGLPNGVAEGLMGFLYEKEKNYKSAINWYKKSYNLGFIRISNNLVDLYKNKLNNKFEADIWIKKTQNIDNR
ncbi:MAG: tetratricopeptide repeat protein [Halarcobacter sp.]